MVKKISPSFKLGPIQLNELIFQVILNSTDNIAKAEQYDFLMPWLGTGLLTSTGQKWHNHRKWLTPAFHFKILDQYVDTISNNANILVGKLMEHVKDDYVNINPMVTLCTLDIICGKSKKKMTTFIQ